MYCMLIETLYPLAGAEKHSPSSKESVHSCGWLLAVHLRWGKINSMIHETLWPSVHRETFDRYMRLSHSIIGSAVVVQIADKRWSESLNFIISTQYLLSNAKWRVEGIGRCKLVKHATSPSKGYDILYQIAVLLCWCPLSALDNIHAIAAEKKVWQKLVVFRRIRYA